jgi:hypothetical protein
MRGETFIRSGLELKMTAADRVEDILPAIERGLASQTEAAERDAATEIAAKF